VGQAAGLLDEQVDRFGSAVGHAVGSEVGEHLLAPAAQGAAESGDLGDRAGRERLEYPSAMRLPSGEFFAA
jgi:hypothetical protein